MASSTNEYIKTVNYFAARRNVLLTTLEDFLNQVQDAFAANTSFLPLRNIAKKSILSILHNIQHGQLDIESEGEVFRFGAPFILHTDGPPKHLHAAIKVLDETFWVRIFLYMDFGFADSYMLHQIEVDSLNNIFRIFVLNRAHLSEMRTILSPIIRTVSYIANLRFANALLGSKSNISTHYDLSNEIFAAFLSWDMTYSCAVFDNDAKGCTGDLTDPRPIAPPRKHYNDKRPPPDDLERGQMEKLHLIARRARIRPGSHVLEIGCGWGSFAILAAGTYGATVEAITISDVQKLAIDENIQAAGLSDHINVHVMDYRSMPPSFHQAFDAVVSIGVMEHVGLEFMKGWFKQMSWAMKTKNSVKSHISLHQIFSWIYLLHYSEVDFVRKYIYPGGQLSSIKTLVDDIAAAGLNIESIENIGPHYARTLREWSYRFQANFESHIKPALNKQYPELNDINIEIFRRKWIYYFAYSEAGFALRSISDSVFVLTREANIFL
ncbi:cyclopropane-fatty-acyl-phospholipid synthase [Lentinula aff. lateritia]|uniref:Cyclopropane-fatty-acyl-phospholipid synthase n=1 Tax=Lentinula aff. lateritia TaxID=2804960 RepID=A0ACC1THD2_9AGAR|nr:cyclopropane-fatty-acyl-phospholipid synthase [Lentinula aff. lateritia]